MTALTPAAHTIHWSPSFGGQPDLPAIVHATADAGFELIGLDLATVEVYLDNGGTLKELERLLSVAALGVTDVVALSIGPGRDLHDLAQRLAALIETVGAACCVGAVTQGIASPEAIDGFADALTVIGPTGARLAVEFGGYMGLRDLAESEMVCDQLGWDRAGVLIDTYQCSRAGVTPDQVAALAPDRVALVQVADAVGPPPLGEALMTESRHHRKVPGEGSIPIGEYLAAAVGTGYRGPLAVEVLADEIRFADPVTASRQLHRAMSSIPDRSAR